MKYLTKSDHSDIYEDQDPIHGHVAIKKLGARKDGDWLIRQKQGYDIISEMIEKFGWDKIGVNLPQLISMSDTGKASDENSTITEKFINGKSFRDVNYESLSEQQKDELAKQIALFLNSMHQLHEPQKPIESIKITWEREKVMEEINTLSQTVDAFEGKLSKQSKKLVSDAENYLKTHPIDDEIHVMTHWDLHRSNLMYDADKNQITVIDFELARIDNIYRDFVPYMATATLPWDFYKRIIKSYNTVPNKEYPISIDIEKVKNAIIYDAARINARDIELHFKGDVDFAVRKMEEFLKQFVSDNSENFLAASKKLKSKSAEEKTVVSGFIKKSFQND